jgi:hypothetical protein
MPHLILRFFAFIVHRQPPLGKGLSKCLNNGFAGADGQVLYLTAAHRCDTIGVSYSVWQARERETK